MNLCVSRASEAVRKGFYGALYIKSGGWIGYQLADFPPLSRQGRPPRLSCCLPIHPIPGRSPVSRVYPRRPTIHVQLSIQ